jgi:hypothetical protein
MKQPILTSIAALAILHEGRYRALDVESQSQRYPSVLPKIGQAPARYRTAGWPWGSHLSLFFWFQGTRNDFEAAASRLVPSGTMAGRKRLTSAARVGLALFVPD